MVIGLGRAGDGAAGDQEVIVASPAAAMPRRKLSASVTGIRMPVSCCRRRAIDRI